jgi:putative oxidoreductase
MRKLTLWGLTIVAAGMFLLAGTLKLIGVEMEVQLFAAIGIGQWFRYLTGALEVAGAVALFVPALAPRAALLLAGVMTGATVTHLFIVGGSPIAAILLLAATLTIAWLRSEQISSRRVAVA